MFSLATACIAISAFSLLYLRKFAVNFGWVDKPTQRKVHHGDIPYVGGLSLFLSIVFIVLIEPSLIPHHKNYLFCSSIVLLIGIIDDKLDISAWGRLFILGAMAFWLTYYKGLSISYLGDLFGIGALDLGLWGGVILTSMAMIGCMTAFNMVDGIDGLLGGLATVTFAALAYLFYMSGEFQGFFFCIFFMLAMLPYIICNLDLIPKRSLKVFMGDSGSYFIGFSVVWLLMDSSQHTAVNSDNYILAPVTALWIIAIPLCDMTMVMVRRLRKRSSPLKPDRLHLHHICQRLGLSKTATLGFIVGIATLHAIIGIWGQEAGVKDFWMFAGFLLSFSIYMFIISYAWRITSYLRRWKKRLA